MLDDTTMAWLTAGLFGLTYLALAVGGVPGLRMDRTTIALVGATLMLVSGALTLDQAVGGDSIDYKTLALLFGMMIVIAYLRISGVFQWLTAVSLRRLSSPRSLLATVICLSGALSAFLINDVVCLVLTPVVLRLAQRLRLDPVPHLIALATAANIGSVGTITGNPQNIYIGSHSGLPYAWFAAHLLPVALVGLVIDYVLVCAIYRDRLSSDRDFCWNDNGDERFSLRAGRLVLARKSAVVAVIAIALFFTGLPLEIVALGAAAVLLVGEVKPRRVFHEVDWSLLVLFAGLFIVVYAFRIRVVDQMHVEQWDWLLSRPIGLLSLVSALLSNLVSNVPAVLLLEPVVSAMPLENRATAWLALAMSSTLAGNLTVLGSIANLIVIENARHRGVAVSFWEYSKVGIPLTISTLVVGIVWLACVL